MSSMLMDTKTGMPVLVTFQTRPSSSSPNRHRSMLSVTMPEGATLKGKDVGGKLLPLADARLEMN